MRAWEILEWCKNHNYLEKLAALLSIFTPDVDELNSWDISEINDNVFSVNGVKYNILSEQEVEDGISIYKEDVELDYAKEVPELAEHVNWKKFWKANPITVEMCTEGYSVIVFRGVKYYYLENV